MVPTTFSWVVDVTIAALVKFAAVIFYSPIFVLPGALVAMIGAWIGRMYLAAQLPVKREASKAKSPVFSHFGTSVAGVTSIRAFGAEESFKAESRKRIDGYTRPARTTANLNRCSSVRTPESVEASSHGLLFTFRWVAVRINTLGGVFETALAAYLFYWRSAYLPIRLPQKDS